MNIANLKADVKNAWKSWTVQFNAVIFPLLAMYWPQIWEVIQQLQPVLPDSKYQVLLTINMVANILLRFKSNSALRDK